MSVAVPEALGVTAIDDVGIADLVAYIDWTPFFHVWELRGRYPAILERDDVGAAARDVFEAAQTMLKEWLAAPPVTPRGVYGFFAAASAGDDLLVFQDPQRTTVTARFPMLRMQRAQGEPPHCTCLADYVAPLESGLCDYIGAFAVTSGLGLETRVAQYEAAHDDYHAIMAKALADRLAEAFAELVHARMRRVCGFGQSETLSPAELLNERYRGIRPAFGYPACPYHPSKGPLFELLQAQARTGMRLTDNFAMWPAASVCGLVLNHPQAHYFAVGAIGADQLGDFAVRAEITEAEAARWLRPYL